MRVAHICLSSFFIDNRAYQENELAAAHMEAGHDVLVIASTHVHGSDGRRAFTEPGDYRTQEGARVVRLPYHPGIPHALAKSLRIHRGVYRLLETFAPHTILFHGMCGWELLTAARYRRNHPDVPLFVDTHTDFLTSARSVTSKWILHYMYYRPIVHRALPWIDKILCISTLTEDFARDFYGIPRECLEFYPLGGRPQPDEELERRRISKRAELGVGEDEILLVQTGKQSAKKRLPEALRALAAVPEARLRMVIAGLLMDDVRTEVEQLISNDPRVSFLGWQNPNDIEELLCAADVYLQPGSQSSTLQTSLCCGCAVILENLRSHEPYIAGNGWLLGAPSELTRVFQRIAAADLDLDIMRVRSLEIARKCLDYERLAQRVLPEQETRMIRESERAGRRV